MKIKITKLMTSQGSDDYYFPDLQTDYLEQPGNQSSSVVDTSIYDIPDDLVLLKAISSNTLPNLALDLYLYGTAPQSTSLSMEAYRALVNLSGSYA